MNKILTLTLGTALLAGAAAGSWQAFAAETQANDFPEGAMVNVNSVYGKSSADWSVAEQGFVIKAFMNNEGYYYDEDYNRQNVTIDTYDKIILTRQEGYYGDAVTVNEVTDFPAGTEYTYIDKTAEKGISYNYRLIAVLGASSNNYESFNPNEGGDYPAGFSDETVSYTTVNGSYPVEITVVAPSTYTDGSEITGKNLEKIEVYQQAYSWYGDGEKTILAEQSDVVPGSTLNFSIIEGLEDGSNEIKVAAYTEDGRGDIYTFNIILGTDNPAAPTNVVANVTEETKVTISWDPVTKGVNGGFINAENMTYAITVYENGAYYGTELVNSLTDCEYTYTVEYTSPTQLQYSVKADCEGKSSSETKTGSVIAGPAISLPFLDGFDAGSYYSKEPEQIWGIANNGDNYAADWRANGSFYPANGSSVGTASGEGGMFTINTYYESQPYQATATTADIKVGDATSLEYTMLYYSLEGEYTNGISVEASFDGGEWATIWSVEFNGLTTTGWEKCKAEFDVPAGAKTVKLRLVSTTKGSDNCSAAVDDIRLREGGGAQIIYPESAQNLNAVYNWDTAAVDVTFTAPTKTSAVKGDVNGEELPYITKIELLRQKGSGNFEIVNTWEDPTPGAELSYSDSDVEFTNRYNYKVLVYFDDLCDNGVELSDELLIGQLPAEVSNFTVTCEKGKAPVFLTFTLPTKDKKGEDLREISQVTIEWYSYNEYAWYNVKTYEGTEVTLGETINWAHNTDATSGTMRYRVTVYGTGGANYGVTEDTTLGYGTPDQPENVKATAANGVATITWDPVTTGYGGYIDPEVVTYSVTRIEASEYSDYGVEPTVTGLTECTWQDEVEGPEAEYKYYVKAWLGNKSGYSTNSNTVVVGRPAELPFVEKFNTPYGYLVKANNMGWLQYDEDAENGTGFNFSDEDYDNEQKVAAEDGGLAYAYFNNGRDVVETAQLTSPNVNIQGAETPAVTFQYFDRVNGKNTVKVSVSFNGGEFTELGTFKNTEAETGEYGRPVEGSPANQWRELTYALNAPEDATTAQIRFDIVNDEFGSTFTLDNVYIYELPAPVLDSSSTTLTWQAHESEYVALSGYHVYLEGARHTTAPLADAKHEAQKDGNYTVTALYGNHAVETAHSNAVAISGAGVGAVATGELRITANAGNIVVEGAEGLLVTITAVDGAIIYSAEGNATVAVVPATYIVKVADAPAVKLFVR